MRQRFLPLLSLFVIPCLLFAGCTRSKGTVKRDARTPVKMIGTLAVMNFEVRSMDKELGAAVSEVLRSEIAALDGIPYTVVERIMLNKILKEQEMSLTGLVKQSKRAQIGKLLYADHLVIGKVIKIGSNYRINASIVETNSSVVKKQVFEEFRSISEIPQASRSVAYKLFDREYQYIKSKSSEIVLDGFFSSVFSDGRGFHTGGKIYLKRTGDSVTGYNIEPFGKADMNGTVSGNIINGYYKAKYGYGNFSFTLSEDGKSLIGSYYQVSNGANGDWIAVKGDSFSMPGELFTGRWKKGKHVLTKWSGDGYWYPARIGGERNGMYLILYDDGDKEYRLEKYIQELNFREGDVVFGNWQSKGRYFRGTIKEKKGDRIFIHYDDGDKEWTTISKVRVMLP